MGNLGFQKIWVGNRRFTMTFVNKDIGLELLNILKIDFEVFKKSVDGLPDDARAEIAWWFGRMDAYLKGSL